MKQVPQIIQADDLIDNWPLTKIKYSSTCTGTKQWTLARPISLVRGNIIDRLSISWRVFKGELDALKWDSQ